MMSVSFISDPVSLAESTHISRGRYRSPVSAGSSYSRPSNCVHLVSAAERSSLPAVRARLSSSKRRIPHVSNFV